jgi:hypothetical protein
MQIRSLVCAAALSAVACTTVYAPLPPVRDAGPRDAYVCGECPDTGAIVRPRDAGRDVGPLPDANVDAAFVDSGTTTTDAGAPLAITVDGALSDLVWTEQVPLVLTVSAFEPFAGDHLDSLFFFRDETYLYIAFEGELLSGASVAMYVDLGTTFSDVSLMGMRLDDTSGEVDATLSIPLFGTAEFAPEFGWGTAMMPHVASAGGTTIGWRRLASVGAFTLITTGNRSACSATACETAIALATLGATTDSRIDFIVRLGRSDVGWSNQTFPASSSGTPEYVDFSLSVPPATL